MRSSFLLVLVLSLAAAARAEESRYVVTLAQTATMDAESLAATYGGKVLRVIDEVTIEVEVPSSRARLLSHDARVLGMRASNFRVATSGWTSAMSFAYDAAGNVRQIGSDTFACDGVDRVVSATVSSGTETFTTETFTYDAFGNRTGCTNVTAGNSACQTVTIASGTNRISGMSYDAMGNLEQGGIYAYDSVGMLKRDTATGASREYLYTADDERLAVVVGGSNWTWTLRDLSGKVLREYTSTSSSGNHSNWTWMRDNVYRNGQMLSSLQPGGNGATVTWHYHVDHLGTPRVLSSTTGTILAVHDYGAFGTEISGNAAEAPLSRMKYTGHERDTFNNPSNPLDYMHARYYSAMWGRFLSVDPGEAELDDPQSWNRYSYAGNNPVSHFDPDGESKRSFLVRMATGAWRRVERAVALRTAAKGAAHGVIVEGAGSSKASRKLVKDAYPHRPKMRDNAHVGGPASGPEMHRPHWQPKKDGGGQVNYVFGALGFIAGWLPYVGDLVDADELNADETDQVSLIRAELIAKEAYGKTLDQLTPQELQSIIDIVEGRKPYRPEKKKDPKDEPGNPCNKPVGVSDGVC